MTGRAVPDRAIAASSSKLTLFEVDERLWEIEKVRAVDGEFEAAFVTVKQMIYELRLDVTRAGREGLRIR